MSRIVHRTLWLTLFLAIAFNSPPVLIHAGPLGILALLPLVVWSLAAVPFSFFLPNHFGITDFGPEPETPFAVGLVVAVWCFVAWVGAVLLVRIKEARES